MQRWKSMIMGHGGPELDFYNENIGFFTCSYM